MNLDLEKINSLINGLKDNLKKLRELSLLSIDDFLNDFRNYNAALRLLQISIESMINIGNHIIARKGLRSAKDFSDIFKILLDAKIIDEEEYRIFVAMVKFRNRIVHIYWDIDLQQIYTYLSNNLGDFEIFLKRIHDFLKWNIQ